MRLTLLRGQLTRFEVPRTFVNVETVAEADSLWFLCPKCFRQNGGPVGTHGIRVDFLGRRVPAHICIHNDQGQPVWWSVEGTSIEDITTNPSILILGGCAWHGWIRSGQAVEA